MAQKKSGGKPEVPGIVEQFNASGLTQREFAKQEGVPLSTLNYWIRRQRLEREIAAEPRKTALVVVAETPKACEGGFVVRFGEFRIEVPRDASVKEWQRLRDAWAS